MGIVVSFGIVEINMSYGVIAIAQFTKALRGAFATCGVVAHYVFVIQGLAVVVEDYREAGQLIAPCGVVSLARINLEDCIAARWHLIPTGVSKFQQSTAFKLCIGYEWGSVAFGRILESY